MDINIEAAPVQAGSNTISVLRTLQAQEAIKSALVSSQVTRVQGRIRAFLATLTFDNGKQCLTDDGEVYLGLLLPHYVELAHLSDRMAFPEAVARLRLWIPYTVEKRGIAWIEREWSRLTEERSIALTARDASPEHRGKGYVYWLPRAETISRDLNLTRARRDAINATYAIHEDGLPIRGIPAVDQLSPEAMREADRVRKEHKRRTNGVKPQSKRTASADIEAFCQNLGISRRQWLKAEGLGHAAVLDLIDSRGGAILRADKICPGNIISKYGLDTFCPVLIKEKGMAIFGSVRPGRTQASH